MKNLAIVFLLLLCSLSCEEDDEVVEKEITLEGHLYKNCAKDPYAGMTLNFYYIRYGSLLRDSEKRFHLTTVTDSTGFYSIKHKAKLDHMQVENEKNQLVFGVVYNAQKYLNNPYDYYDNYSRTKLKHPVKIKTDRSFTELDTIFMGATSNFDAVFKLNGPFENNQVSETDFLDFAMLSDLIAPFDTHTTATAIFFWAIGSEQYNKISTNAAGFSSQQILSVPQRICDGDTVVIDLRGL